MCEHNEKGQLANNIAVVYHIAGNFDIFDAFQPDCQNLTCQFFKSMQHLLKDSETIRQNIFHQIFEKSVSVKFSLHQNFPLYGIS